MSTVTLFDGRAVDSASEPWRQECEARHILAMPGVQARRDYLEAVLKRRGAKHHQALADLVRALWTHNRAHG